MLVYLWTHFKFSDTTATEKASKQQLLPGILRTTLGTAALWSMCPLHSESQRVGCVLSIPQRSGTGWSKLCSLSGQQEAASCVRGVGPRSPPQHHPACPRCLTPHPAAPLGCCGREKVKSNAGRCCTRVGALLGSGPSFPCQTASPRGCSDLPLPEPSCPRGEREKDGKWEKAYS